MKNVLIFISGIVFCLTVIFFIGASNINNEDDGLRGAIFFEKEGNCLYHKNLEVFQVIVPDAALTHMGDTLALLVNDEGKYYYDGEKIQMPKKKCAKQIGVYTYMTKAEMQRTVPIVEIK